MRLISLQDFTELTRLATVGMASEALRFGVVIGLFQILPVVFSGWRAKRQINGEVLKVRQIRRELFLAATSLCIFGVMLGIVFLSRKNGLTQIYLSISDRGWVYFLFSVVLIIVLHDAFFYWSHRLLHVRFLFERIHFVHHLSLRTTAMSALAFHPVEAVIQVLILPLVAFLIPVHPLALFFFSLYQTIFNSYGHCGYEGYPKWFADNKWTRAIITPTYHSLHHARGVGNYGLYYTFWDRLCGTERGDYQQTFRELVELNKRISSSG